MTARQPRPSGYRRLTMHGMALAACMMLLAAAPAGALSEIKPDENAPPANPDEIQSVPLPPPVGTPSSPDTTAPAGDENVAPDDEEVTPDGEDEATPAEPAEGGEDGEPVQTELPKSDPNAPLPEVMHDTAQLPEPVRRMHGLLLEATKTGDIEKLRPLVGTGDGATQLSFGDTPADPIAFLKEVSGDDEGQEILAILEEVLEAGFVHLDEGEAEELYVWPYFFAVPLDRLTPPQRVELFRLVTAGDYEEMKAYGAYIFYRVGFAPDGRWAFFVAGD